LEELFTHIVRTSLELRVTKAKQLEGHQSEVLRYMSRVNRTMTIDIAFRKISRTEKNLSLAEEELDRNTLGLEEGQIVEERKTLQ